jgi:hypothetical protein
LQSTQSSSHLWHCHVRACLQAEQGAVLVQRLLAAMFKATDVASPYLDGELNVDAADVAIGDEAGALVDTDIDEAAPEATALVTGVKQSRVLPACLMQKRTGKHR